MKLKAIELKVRAEIEGVVHEAGEVIEIAEHWAEWLIEGKRAAPAKAKPGAGKEPAGAGPDSGTKED